MGQPTFGSPTNLTGSLEQRLHFRNQRPRLAFQILYHRPAVLLVVTQSPRSVLCLLPQSLLNMAQKAAGINSSEDAFLLPQASSTLQLG